MTGFANLINAAREFIDERIETVEENAFGDYTQEDIDSVHHEAHAIEAEIAAIGRIVESACAIASMRHPSIEAILRKRGFAYEADRIARLVRAVD
ncbi:hypothetical protein, partial [Tepidimonas sp.]|uniref:hypothetical protein n=1 Tax=Tepidimonas sp. TaxID=2002775 RepID=UPI00391D1B2B